jgi:hypothetical protein
MNLEPLVVDRSTFQAELEGIGWSLHEISETTADD